MLGVVINLLHIPILLSVDILLGSIRIGKCRFQDAQTGALFLAPHSNNRRLALVLLGNSLEGLKDVVSLAAPTIPPMTRSPVSVFM